MAPPTPRASRSASGTQNGGRASRQTKAQQDAEDPVAPRLADEESLEASATNASEGSEPESPAPTPSRRKRGRPPKSPGANGSKRAASVSGTPSNSRKKNVVATPIHLRGTNGVDTPRRRNMADRSARRKSTRAMIDRVVGGASSDEDAGDEVLAREMYESSDEEEDEEEEDEDEDEEGAEQDAADPEATPSRRGRGRKRKAPIRKRARQKSPTPPLDLPPYEQYFYQNKPGVANKTSNNTLASLELLTHEEYFTLLPQWENRHAADVQYLESLHAESFPQWCFELSQGFSVCLYGYGSKKPLLTSFATHLFRQTEDHDADKIVVVNGYLRNTTTREILSAVGKALDPAYKLPAGTPVTMVQDVLAHLSAHGGTITLVVHCIDAPPLRKQGTQAILAQLAAHDKVRLACSANTADFALLWDGGLRSGFNFVFHDCTTFAPYTAEIDVVDEVHELVGRKARRVGGKDGVVFVLRSLPENARSLFRLLVGEVLVAMEEEGGDAPGGEGPGIEYRMLYNKAVEEFICSSEMAYRLLLKEFHDHQIIATRQDAIGTEVLSLPFRKEELEAILEDLMS
ncbi:ORC2-domain-containing protein [Thozetella sp. PMI_491]|nr:ORC2-domain-containing protein [Thozetella sp. PMI_491]